MAEREIQVYSYTLNIQSVKMKVKFPCKMKLEYAGEVLTPQVSQNETGKFIFNQEVTLKEDTTDRAYFEIIAAITTDKNAKYIAGVIKLAQSELVHQQGEMMVLHLAKCLDSQACCQLRVDQVSSEKVIKKVPLQKALLAKSRADLPDFTPKRNLLSPGFQNTKNNFGTKSQFQFPITNTRQLGQNRYKEQGNLSIYDRARSRSPNNNFRKTNIAATYIQRNLPQFGALDANSRDKLIEAEVYKESYQKLKQKYKKQAQTAKNQLNKRIALQNNENNFKLEIMRLKLRCEEQQKAISDKNSKIKEMQGQLAALQKKQLDLNYLREESANKEHTIRMLEDTIRALNRDNDDLKNLSRERFQSQQEKIRDLRAQLDSNRQKFELRISEYQRQLKSKIQIISQKESELRIRQQRIQREQRLVDQLEKATQTKSLEYERTIAIQQNQSKTKIEEFKHIIQKLEKEKAKLEQQLQNSRSQHEKIKSYIIKIQYDKKILSQETDGFKYQLNQLKNLKEKHQQLLRDHRLLSEDKNHLQKQYEKSLQTKDSNIAELSRQHQQQIEHYRRIYKQVEEKLRNSQNRIIQLESSLEQRKNQNQKLRRNNESLSKQLGEVKDKQKSLKKSLKNRQEQYTQLSAQLESSKYKSKSGDQLTRYEIEGLKQELAKTKRDLEVETLKTVQFTQKIASLNNELSKNRLQLQHITDQGEKDNTNYKERIISLENHNREYEKRVDDLNTQATNLRNSDKENQTKLQKYEIDMLKNNEKVEKFQKQIKNYEQKVQQYENQIRNKQNQISNVQYTKENLEKKILDYEQKLTNTKNNLNTVTSEKNKNDKIIELLNKQISDFKQEIERLNKFIQGKEKQQQDLREELKKSKEEYLKLQMKNTALKKQYQRFKEHLQETLTSTFSQIPLNNADLKASSASVEPIRRNNNSNSQNYDTNAFNAQILTKINSQNKDVKIAMAKLIEQNKLLQKEIEKISEEGFNTHAKNQLNEAAFNKRIEQLEDELQRVFTQKEDQNFKHKTTIHELHIELQQRENTNKDLLIQIQELNFTINSLKMDQQANIEHYNLKITQHKSKIVQLDEKINYLSMTLTQTQGKCHDLEIKLGEKSAQLEVEKDTNSKKTKQIKILNEEKKNNLLVIEESKKQRKQLLQKISQLQLKLSTEIQLKEKGKSLLEEEERKGTELKQFVANLMKQKELAIKGDLEKSQQIIMLEGNLIEANREKEMKDEEIERLRKVVEENKESIRKLTNQLKDLQVLGTDEKGKSTKLNQKLREKEKQLKQYEQSYTKLKSEFQILNVKSNKTITELQYELEQAIKKKDKEIEQLTARLGQVQKQLQEIESKGVTLKSEILILQENLFMEKQAKQVKIEESNKLCEEIEQLKAQIKHLQETINTQNEEMREKQENMFQISGKLYQLQSKLDGKENEKNERITLIIQDWTSKYDTMIDEYQQRIDLVEKEKNYFKSRLEQKEEQYRKLVAEVRNNELEDAGLKKALEEKVRRLQQQRLALISSKNAQLQRLAEDNKSKFQTLKAKQADLRKLQHQLEVARTTISKFQQTKRQTEQKIRQINKAYQSELEQLKKKQATARSSALELERIQWNVERQVKKTIQNYTKKLASTESKEQNQRILLTIKGLEDEIVNAIQHKMSGASNA